MLYLKQQDYDRMLEHCKKGLPNEACGLIGGRKEGRGRSVCGENISADECR